MSSSLGSAFHRPISTAERYTQRLRFGFAASLPLVMQKVPEESGLACLAMVAGFHGDITDMSSLRSRFADNVKDEVTPTALMEMGAAMFMDARLLRVDRADLGKLRKPCVLHWGANHFVVLKQVLRRRRGIVIHDPAVGERRVRRSELARKFSEIEAIELSPGADFKLAEAERPSNLSWFKGSIKGFGRSLSQIALLAMALQLLVLAAPLAVQSALDTGLVFGDRELIGMLAAGGVLLVLGHAAVGAMRSWMVMYMMSHVNLQWLTNAFTHLLRLPATYFEQREIGEVASRFQSIHTMQKRLGSGFIEGLLDGSMAVAALAVMLFYSVPMTLVALSSVLVYALLRWAVQGTLAYATQQELLLDGREQAIFLESVQGVQSIKLFGRERERRTRWLDTVVDSMNRKLTVQKLSVLLQGARNALMGIEAVAVLWMAAQLAMNGSFTMGMLVAFVGYKLVFSQRAFALVDRVVELKMLRLHAERVADVLLSKVERPGSSSQKRKYLPTDATLELREVWFRYGDEEPWLLKNVNLKVLPGEAVAIVGASGCGKTTLMKLMLGLLQPTRGEILLGGVPVGKLGTATYRKMIGAVMQEDQLFAGTLLENISFFSESPSMERVVSGTTSAAIHDEIERMPLGYQTPVRGMGASLSSGQKQRILLARALYRSPKLLMLDEATSQVDAKCEAVINEAVRKMPITRILVAHRPEAVRGVQRVLVLENGTISKDLASVPAAVINDVVSLKAAKAVNDPRVAAKVPVLKNVLPMR